MAENTLLFKLTWSFPSRTRSIFVYNMICIFLQHHSKLDYVLCFWHIDICLSDWQICVSQISPFSVTQLLTAANVSSLSTGICCKFILLWKVLSSALDLCTSSATISDVNNTTETGMNQKSSSYLTATAAEWAQGIVGPNSRSRHGSIGLSPVCLSLTVHTREK